MSDTPRTDAISRLVREYGLSLHGTEHHFSLRDSIYNGIANLERELAAAQKDAARLNSMINVVFDNLPYLENLIIPTGHESVLLKKHPQPCVGHDFCLIRQAQKGSTAIREAIDAAMKG